MLDKRSGITKDELLEHLFDLKRLACVVCLKEEKKCFFCGIKLGTIHRILSQHFSITEQERKEAIKQMLEWGPAFEHDVNLGVYKTILRALGKEPK